jgi:signal transduction histidine kinase
VLQGATDALRGGGAAPAAGLARARSVLREITGSLDNTLAVSTRLIEARAPALRDADVGMLVDLVLGDLPEEGRARVHVDRDPSVRTAALDIGLMRLALRNLLNNALAYATPGTPVTLRVTDSDEPLALLVEVSDEGPGIAPGLLPRLFERGVRGRHDIHGQGLGLYIVRRAMQMQRGRVELRSDAAGTTFTLILPQGQEPD